MGLCKTLCTPRMISEEKVNKHDTVFEHGRTALVIVTRSCHHGISLESAHSTPWQQWYFTFLQLFSPHYHLLTQFRSSARLDVLVVPIYIYPHGLVRPLNPSLQPLAAVPTTITERSCPAKTYAAHPDLLRPRLHNPLPDCLQ